MISPSTERKTRGANQGTRTKRSALRVRTTELLRLEIEFIDHPEFRRLDPKEVLSDAERLLATPGQSRGLKKQVLHPQFNMLCAQDLLEKDDEKEVFRVMNFLKYRANTVRSALNPKRPSIRRIREIEKCLGLAKSLRNYAVRANTRLVVSIAKSFQNDHSELDELISEGLTCLVRVVEKFDYGRGFRFSTYATWAIRNRMLRAREQSQRYSTRFRSGANPLAFEASSEADPQVLAAARKEILQNVGEAMDVLNERERMVIESRAGFRDLDCKPTLKNIGVILGISKERVRQIERNGLEKVRTRIEEMKTNRSRRTP